MSGDTNTAPSFADGMLRRTTIHADTDQYSFGRALDAGDVDGDGVVDLIIGASSAKIGTVHSVGNVRVVSGATGAVLHTFSGQQQYESFGEAVASAGDVDGDGHADVIIGAPDSDVGGVEYVGRVEVRSGRTGEVLHALQGASAQKGFGVSVAGLGDLDGDGRSDFAIGQTVTAYDPTTAGSVRVYSGATGQVLHTLIGDAASQAFGGSLANAGDVDGDGRDDLVIGAYGSDPGGRTNAGAVRVVSGATGATLYQLEGRHAGDQFGRKVAGAGDVNGDGYADIIIGSHLDGDKGFQSGSARVVSGATGATLYEWFGSAGNDLFGYAVDGAGDVNGDGHADLIVTANHWFYNPSVRLISGATGQTLSTFSGGANSLYLGSAVSSAGDLDGDGLGDVMVTAPREGFGAVRVFTTSTLDARPVAYFGQRGVVLDADASLRDAELDAAGSYAGSVLTLQRHGAPHAADLFGATGGVTLSESVVWLDGVAVGGFTQADGVLTIIFNAAATPARADAVLRSLTYAHGGEPEGDSAWIAYAFHDGTQGEAGVSVAEGRIVVTLERMVAGGTGADVLVGTAHRETYDGGDGDDVLRASAGDDTYLGGAGRDRVSYIYSSSAVVVDLARADAQGVSDGKRDRFAGVEDVYGSGFDDQLRGDRGANWLAGGAGDDVLFAGSGADLLDGGSGIDKVQYDRFGRGVTVDLATGRASGGAGLHSLTAVENIGGTFYADTLYGDGADNVIDGDGGDDVLSGRGGDDHLLGGSHDDDTLFGGLGDDWLDGGSHGDDTLVGGLGNDTLEGGSWGSDTASYADATGAVAADLTLGTASGAAGADSLVDVENLRGSGWNDTLIGDANHNRLQGLGGHDIISGGQGDDSLAGGLGNDQLDGGAGDSDVASFSEAPAGVEADLMAGEARGGAGVDRLIGIEGLSGSAWSDTLTGDAGDNFLNGFGGDDVLLGGEGDDTLLGGGGKDRLEGGEGVDAADYTLAVGAVRVDLTAGTAVAPQGADVLVGIEDVVGGAYGDRLTGDDSANRLDGGEGDDRLAGGGGTDLLLGGWANDNLAGNKGDDELFGDYGDDRLEGGWGRDELSGGEGQDTFIFSRLWGTDTVSDFEPGETLAFRAASFGLSAGPLDYSLLQVGASASGTTGVFLFNEDLTMLSWDPDGGGAREAEVLVVFDGYWEVRSVEFLLI